MGHVGGVGGACGGVVGHMWGWEGCGGAYVGMGGVRRTLLVLFER